MQGMPVALTDHVDRSPEKNLLRGRVGRNHSWVLHSDEHSEWEGQSRILEQLPLAVLVAFDKAAWTLPGLDVQGLYPIVPKSSDWYLDKNRKVPLLRIKRRQLPLAPAFAMTAHASQGQTLQAAIVDLQLPEEASPLTCYIDLPRVRTRDSILVYRPFSLSLFRKGPPEGPMMLLKKLRGEAIDWEAIRERYAPDEKWSRGAKRGSRSRSFRKSNGA